MSRIGRYNGVDYRYQRICEVLPVSIKARWYFAYSNGYATGDHFKTLTEFKDWVDNGEIAERVLGNGL